MQLAPRGGGALQVRRLWRGAPSCTEQLLFAAGVCGYGNGAGGSPGPRAWGVVPSLCRGDSDCTHTRTRIPARCSRDATELQQLLLTPVKPEVGLYTYGSPNSETRGYESMDRGSSGAGVHGELDVYGYESMEHGSRGAGAHGGLDVYGYESMEHGGSGAGAHEEGDADGYETLARSGGAGAAAARGGLRAARAPPSSATASASTSYGKLQGDQALYGGGGYDSVDRGVPAGYTLDAAAYDGAVGSSPPPAQPCAGGGNPGPGPVDSQHYGNPQPGERRGTNWGGHRPGAGAKEGPGFKRAGSVYPGFGDDEEMTI